MGGEEEDLSRGELTVLTVHFVQKETGEGRSRGDRDLTPLSLSLSLSLFLILACFIPYIFTIPQKSAAQALFASYENRRSKSLLASSRVLGKENYAAWEGIESRINEDTLESIFEGMDANPIVVVLLRLTKSVGSIIPFNKTDVRQTYDRRWRSYQSIGTPGNILIEKQRIDKALSLCLDPVY